MIHDSSFKLFLKKYAILFLITIFLSTIVLGCLTTVNKPPLIERDIKKELIPSISGTWELLGSDRVIYTIEPTEFSNTYNAIHNTTTNHPLESYRLYFENLGFSYFVVQIVEKKGNAYLTVCELSDKKIIIYQIQGHLGAEALKKIAGKYGVTVETSAAELEPDLNHIIDYKTVDGLFGFFYEIVQNKKNLRTSIELKKISP